MLKDCIRCKTPQKNIYSVVVAVKLKANLCVDCYNAWFDKRDKTLEETFREFLVTKTK